MLPAWLKPHLGLAAAAAVMGPGFTVHYRAFHDTAHMTGVADRRRAELPFRLVDVSQASGAVNVHQPRADPNFASMLTFQGAAAAVVDFDNDGWPDLYVTNSRIGSSNRLFRNNHDGTFTDVAEKVGLARVNERRSSLRAIFFDVDNDGWKDLLITRYGGCPSFYRNVHGRFVEK